MLTRKQIEERLASSPDQDWEREALQTALQLAEWLEQVYWNDSLAILDGEAVDWLDPACLAPNK